MDIRVDMYTYTRVYVVVVIVITTYHAVYWSYRASRTDRWFLPCSIPWVPGLPKVAHLRVYMYMHVYAETLVSWDPQSDGSSVKLRATSGSPGTHGIEQGRNHLSV